MYENLIKSTSFMDMAVRTCYISWYNYNTTISVRDTKLEPWPKAAQWKIDILNKGISDLLKMLSDNKDSLAGQTPPFLTLVSFFSEKVHEVWLKRMVEAGWTYGITRDANRKKSPCILPYASLSLHHQAKNDMFVSTVLQLVSGLLPL